MSKGGIRPRSSDGSLDHLLKPKWRSGPTRTIRVPIALADQLLDLARRLDNGEHLDMTQDNKLQEDQQEAIKLLRTAITPRAEGGSYAANNATGIKRLVSRALTLLS